MELEQYLGNYPNSKDTELAFEEDEFHKMAELLTKEEGRGLQPSPNPSESGLSVTYSSLIVTASPSHSPPLMLTLEAMEESLYPDPAPTHEFGVDAEFEQLAEYQELQAPKEPPYPDPPTNETHEFQLDEDETPDPTKRVPTRKRKLDTPPPTSKRARKMSTDDLDKGRRLCTEDLSHMLFVENMKKFEYKPNKGKTPDWKKYKSARQMETLKCELRRRAEEAKRALKPGPKRKAEAERISAGLKRDIADVDNARTHKQNVLHQALLWALELGQAYIQRRETEGLSDAEYRRLHKQLEANTHASFHAYMDTGKPSSL